MVNSEEKFNNIREVSILLLERRVIVFFDSLLNNRKRVKKEIVR